MADLYGLVFSGHTTRTSWCNSVRNYLRVSMFIKNNPHLSNFKYLLTIGGDDTKIIISQSDAPIWNREFAIVSKLKYSIFSMALVRQEGLDEWHTNF